MRFLVRAANKNDFKPSDARRLLVSTYQVVRGYGADVGNLRVSGTAVELDVLLENEEDLKRVAKALERSLGPILTVRELDTPSPQIEPKVAIREGIAFFNEERYWESHEALESAWRRAEGDEKVVLQGIILVAAALVHLQKNKPPIALGVLKRAREKLGERKGEYFGIDFSDLQTRLAGMLALGQPQFFKLQTNLERRREVA